MKKVCVLMVIALVAMGFSMQTASALPPFNKEWVAKYNADGKNAAYSDAKCNVCHAGESKKMKNEYGKAVGKFMTKSGYNAVKDDEAAGKKYILEGLQKAEAEKNASGTSYGDLVKAGKLPGA